MMAALSVRSVRMNAQSKSEGGAVFKSAVLVYTVFGGSRPPNRLFETVGSAEYAFF